MSYRLSRFFLKKNVLAIHCFRVRVYRDAFIYELKTFELGNWNRGFLHSDHNIGISSSKNLEKLFFFGDGLDE